MGKQWKQCQTLYLGGSKITADGDCSHEIKRHLLLGRKAMRNLDSILKSRDITLLTKVHIVKPMVFPVVMYRCECGCGLVAQSCLTLCDPMDYIACQAPLSTGILQARVLEWIAISFSRGIFPTQGSNPSLPHCRQMFYGLSHQGSPSVHDYWKNPSFDYTDL